LGFEVDGSGHCFNDFIPFFLSLSLSEGRILNSINGSVPISPVRKNNSPTHIINYTLSII